MKILCVDDHALFRQGVRHILSAWKPDAEIFEAADLEECLALLDRHRDVDLVLLDIMMPGMDGLAGLQKVSECVPQARVVVVSALETRDLIRHAIKNGAAGYIPKSLPTQIVVNALQLVVDGGTYLPIGVLADESGAAQTLESRSGGATPKLTARQIEVLHSLADGHSNKEIARALCVTEGTVKLHIASLLRALGVRNRTQAAVKARLLGLVVDETAGDTESQEKA